ncbi:MAG: SCO1664 family protein [Acidimicrobiia bacterium]
MLGRITWASNATFLARVRTEGRELAVVYKPRAGERPLWDFPAGTLCLREVAAYRVSESLGWEIVPATTFRQGPLGEGMVQRFVDHDPGRHYLVLRDLHPERFRRFAAFDAVVNNADRKAGHCLEDPEGHVWGVDHGVTFHADPKLRTVIWDFSGGPLDGELAADLARLGADLEGRLGSRLARLLSGGELEALRSRVEMLRLTGVLPAPGGRYPYPWPLV